MAHPLLPRLLPSLTKRSSLLPSSTPTSLPARATTTYICLSCAHQSTYRRHRKALNVKPAPSFQPSKTEPKDHIIHNPPSSISNVYHTPQLFLPTNDPRRKFFSTTSSSSSSSTTTTSQPPPTEAGKKASAAATSASIIPPSHSHASQPPTTTTAPLPPTVRNNNRPHEKKYHLTPEQIAEMRTLRLSDPKKWSRAALAKKFECSPFFVSLCVGAPREVLDERERKLEEVKRRWGRRKADARLGRQVRKERWGRDA